ncbi:MAG TPA: alpha/beta hydrolase [Chloroflexota bacterium]|nr:alpha/beta hydrolase [Chloroflexota bacterium]
MSPHDFPARRDCVTTCPRLPDEPDFKIRHEFVEANGLRFHYVEAGSGPLVLLLHGFPEFWYAWRRQIPALAQRFRVVAPDLRGYNLTDKPPRGYGMDVLVRDVLGLLDGLGAERAAIVGHDWGGAIAWAAATWHPNRVERLAILNAPHPAAYLRELRHGPRQWLKGWYILFFQLPDIPEWALGRRDCQAIGRALRNSAVDPEAFSADDLAAYRQAMCRPGALRASLAYYRALGRDPTPRVIRRRLRTIPVPTLVIWGKQDVALVPELAEGLEEWVSDLCLQRVPDAGHWVQHERPELVNQLLLEFLSEGGDR